VLTYERKPAAQARIESGVLYQDVRWPVITQICVFAWCLPLALIGLTLVDVVAGSSPGILAREAGLLVGVLLAFALRRPKMGFVLTDQAVELHGLVRNRSIPLNEVREFELRRFAGGPDSRVVLDRVDGPPVPVPALVFLSQADEIGRRIGSKCLESHGALLTQSEAVDALNAHLGGSRRPGSPSRRADVDSRERRRRR
jgi:hypothetical protein